MSLGPSLIVPVTLWGRHPPTHRISCVYLTPDQRTLVTGCVDGQIITWTVQPGTLEINPYMMLVGHTARVVCFSDGLLHTNHKYLVSAALNGEMCVWDLQEGQCMETVKMSFIHRQIEAYQPAHAPDVLLFCCGEYADIVVVHPLTLEVVYWLSSKVNSNWVTSLHIFRPKAVTDDIVMAINTDSVVKIWTLAGSEDLQPPADIVYENESKRIRCPSVHFLKCCSYNPRTVLVVSPGVWQIYDASDFSLLCSSPLDDGERWQCGEFLAADRVIVWAESGHAYIYQLPPNCIPTHEQFHSREADEPFLYCVLSSPEQQELFCPPVSLHAELHGEQGQQLLVRGDCLGQLALWRLPHVTNIQLQELMNEQTYQPPELAPTVLWSIERAWQAMKPQPVGILDQLEPAGGGAPRLTSSIYLPLQEGRLVCGREDGTIIIVSATHTVMLHLLHGKHQSYDNWPVHQILSGHRGPVTALLFPHLSHTRYQISHLVSGGEDFSVCLWDLVSGALLHRFVVQAGIVLQLHVPPESVSPRMQQCICSVAADYSVALLSLKERKCLMLASRHLFPVATVKWRPLDDFLVVATEDGSVSVWQMETGHLDRVVHGTTAQEVLSACDENMTVSSTSEGGMANPAVHFFRGLRHRNLSAIRHAAKRGLQQLQNTMGSQGQNGPDKPRAYSLMVQGLRTSQADPDAHVLFFDIESLIVDLLTEAYSQMTTEQLEDAGLIQLTEYQRVLQLTQSESPDAQQKISEFFGRVKHKAGDMEKRLKDKDSRGYLSRMKELKEQSEAIRDHLKERAEGSEDLRKLKSRAQVARTKIEEKIKHEMEDNPDAAGLLARVKEGAETMGGIIQSKAGGAGGLKGAGENRKDSEGELEGRSRVQLGQTENQTMEICQLLLSLIHAWGVDAEIDRLCETKLGMLRPKHPVCYGLISKHGFVSLLLPTFLGGPGSPAMTAPLAERTVTFTRKTHWELSSALTSNHLLAVIALADTLMSMNNTSFMPETERRKRLQKQLTRSLSQSNQANQTPAKPQDGLVELQANFWAQVREGWSKMATLHCVQFPERLDASGVVLKKPLVEMLARRWQDRCIEIRQAAQALLLAELRRLSARSLKALVDWWAPLLPSYGEAPATAPLPAAPLQDEHEHTDGEPEDYGAEDQMEEEAARRAAANAAEARRKQATAIILLGVIGAEFGQEVSGGRAHGVEGFGLGPLALRTSQALAHLLLAPPTPKLPAHTPLRRAAIDLIGRGFAQWEPHIDASRVLLAMLELCCDADSMAPSMTYGLPLAAAADTARTARHAVALIATARPQVFVTTMAREVARYNSLQQNAQSINVVVHHSVLMRAKPEILRVISLLIEKNHAELVRFLIELTDILLHCLDPGHLRQRPLHEVFPAVTRFNQITHCTSSRRVAVGTANGTLAIYDLRQTNKTQQLHAHTKAITACAFSPDGKFLASYSTGENKISFWQTSAGMFGLGHAQTRCVKTYSTPPLPEIVRLNPPRQPRLVWVGNKTVTLLLSDGTEQRYNV